MRSWFGFTRSPLETVHARTVRSIWGAAVKPYCHEAGFRRSAQPGSGLPGWAREDDEQLQTFAFQIDRFGFNRYTGGRFVVEIMATDKRRGTGIRDRLWRLLDDTSRRAAFEMNNRIIKSLPGPWQELVKELHGEMRAQYLKEFEPLQQVPEADRDIWFRYATRSDAEWWGQFVASRLPSVFAECERRLSEQPAGGHLFFGRGVKTKRDGEESA
jgi:hypothetical protein